LTRCDIELMAPRRRNGKKPKSQHGHKLRGYRRRRKVDRPLPVSATAAA